MFWKWFAYPVFILYNTQMVVMIRVLCYFCRGSEYLYVKGVKRLIYPPQHGHIVLLDLYDYPYLLFYS